MILPRAISPGAWLRLPVPLLLPGALVTWNSGTDFWAVW